MTATQPGEWILEADSPAAPRGGRRPMALEPGIILRVLIVVVYLAVLAAIVAITAVRGPAR